MSAGDKKRVRLVIGDGPEKTDIGEAEVTELPDGTLDVTITMEDGTKVRGSLPKLPWIER